MLPYKLEKTGALGLELGNYVTLQAGEGLSTRTKTMLAVKLEIVGLGHGYVTR